MSLYLVPSGETVDIFPLDIALLSMLVRRMHEAIRNHGDLHPLPDAYKTGQGLVLQFCHLGQ
jgi:hypothetical protein